MIAVLFLVLAFLVVVHVYDIETDAQHYARMSAKRRREFRRSLDRMRRM